MSYGNHGPGPQGPYGPPQPHRQYPPPVPQGPPPYRPQGPGPQGPYGPPPGPYPPQGPYRPQGPPPQGPYRPGPYGPPQGPYRPQGPGPYGPGPAGPPPGQYPQGPPAGQHPERPADGTQQHHHQGPPIEPRSSQSSQNEEVISPRSGKVGEGLEGDGLFGRRVAWRIVSVEHPADETFAKAGLSVPEGYASAIVAALFTNKSPTPLEEAPVQGIRLLDSNGVTHASVPAVVSSHPTFRPGRVMDNETIAGHIYFLIPLSVGVRAIQWWPSNAAPNLVLTWLR